MHTVIVAKWETIFIYINVLALYYTYACT